VALHADAVAQNRSARVGAGGIHGDDAYAILSLAVISGKAIHQCALARPRRSGDTGEICLPGVRKKFAQEMFRFRRMVFDGGDGARNGAHLSGADLRGPFVHGQVHQEARPCCRTMARCGMSLLFLVERL